MRRDKYCKAPYRGDRHSGTYWGWWVLGNWLRMNPSLAVVRFDGSVWHVVQRECEHPTQQGLASTSIPACSPQQQQAHLRSYIQSGSALASYCDSSCFEAFWIRLGIITSAYNHLVAEGSTTQALKFQLIIDNWNTITGKKEQNNERISK